MEYHLKICDTLFMFRRFPAAPILFLILLVHLLVCRSIGYHSLLKFFILLLDLPDYDGIHVLRWTHLFLCKVSYLRIFAICSSQTLPTAQTTHLHTPRMIVEICFCL
uniref:Putative secreted peptide n=1 Tax=Anopheles braziliensis TaxID=58242 RepID=A0A2M3ZTA5_9DIPT